MSECLFCRIIKGEIPCHTVWESQQHIGFLSIFPIMQGFTVVASKQHLPSKVQSLSSKDYQALFLAGKQVAERLSQALDVDRCAIVAEGTGVDHAHLKIIPLIGLKPGMPWSSSEVHHGKVFEQYEGYVSTMEGPRADDMELAALAARIRKVTE